MNLTPLKSGDTIGVMAPSSYVERDDIKAAAKIIEERGFNVFIHPQTYEREHQSAGNQLQKSLAFQGLWQRDDIKAVWAAGGGNRAWQILDSINFEKLKNKPKPLIGFSDVTSLLNGIYAHTGISAIHGPVFKNLPKYGELDRLVDLLTGKSYDMPLDEAIILNEGEASGHIIGGNLSIFQYLPGILPNDFWKGSILFLEDCNEELSKIDRMLWYLKRSHIFSEAKAIILGDFGNLPETGRPFGFSLDDVLVEHTKDLDIPILINAPFGHEARLFPLPVGGHGNITLKNGEKKLSVNFLK